ncbi:type II toxin-antitoxin system RelE/ParE family toxin [Thermocoleostomius sinensis]|uniref:Type II toxin-antitoxin system RelE/ParE family toxin n=1 Tax=Thermocoleostomius sinensis A174 TaxID=2016057 RepID=A0A9E8ZDS8_9CYAN|nr:type II toxin-antitoxin system RelE/ParE family toxin [Thermocoleostomius sinensis]WAL61464.1 type II toxin-antitoxin system RelE/ParE family toxin [Thermocoleostomius sinensis A174]
MSYNLIIRPEAELDIQDGFKWYETQVPGLGSEFIRAIDTCLSGIGRNPLAYPLLYQQARRALVRRFPYSILYVFDQNTVSIIACFHSKRNPKSWQERL